MTVRYRTRLTVLLAHSLKKRGRKRVLSFFVLSVLFPVVPDVLHVLVLLQEVDELFHVLHVVLGLEKARIYADSSTFQNILYFAKLNCDTLTPLLWNALCMSQLKGL